MVLFLAADGGATRREGLRRIKERLEKVPGFENVRYTPSRLRPRTVIGDVDVTMFLGRPFPRDAATLEVSWRPREAEDVQRVQWVDEGVSLGWHKDDDHPDLGVTHFQCSVDGHVTHEPANITATAPLRFLETCLTRLPERLEKSAGH